MPAHGPASSQHTHSWEQQQQREPLRLNWLLRAPQPFEDAYWSSHEVQTVLMRLDSGGHLLSAGSMCAFGWLIFSRAAAVRFNVPLAMAVIIGASLLQWVFIRLCPATYRGVRHQLTLGNRLVRLALMLGPVVNGNLDVVHKLLPSKHLEQPGHAGLALLGTMCTLALIQCYSCMCFVMSAAVLLLVQIPAASLTTALSVYAQEGLAASQPGLPQLADSICTHVRGVIELALHVIVDQGTMPGVPAAGFDAFGTHSPAKCAGRASFLQLIIFSNLMLTLYLPVHLTYLVELRHKQRFWKSRGMSVAVRASSLLPVPRCHLASHCCVFLGAQLLLWFMSEALTSLLL